MLNNRFLFPVLLSFFFATSAIAQTPDVDKLSDAQIQQFLQEAEARGMSESQVEAAAMAQGYTPMDVAKMRERINRLKTKTADTTATQNRATRKQVGEIAKRTPITVTDQRNSDNVNSGIKRELEMYGFSIFNTEILAFEPNLNIPTPPDYILGAGDELNVDITGYAYQHYDLKVSPEGTVKLESLAPIQVSGKTVAEAKEQITSRLKSLFAGLRNGSLNIDVTLGNIRSINVTILGEATRPGNYEVSSFATAFNALYLSGGPTKNGSLRNIQVFRNNKNIATIDIYEFLTRGTFSSNVRLNSGDVILIPVANKRVEVDGEVRNPAIFEIKPEETLADVLKYAGGFNEKAYQATLSVTRNTDRERRILTVSPENADNFLTKDGDKLYVGTILERYENKIEVLGAVFRPGEYAINDNLKSVKQLVKTAEGLREDAFLNRALLIREQDNADPILIPLNIGAIMRGEVEDVMLKRQDQLVIKSIVELREERTITVEGAVNNPNVFEYSDGMAIKDLILLAGGFGEGANEKRIEIARRIKSDDATEQSVEIIDLTVSKNLLVTDGDIKLEPFDKVYVRNLSNYSNQKVAKVGGEVNYPGNYAIQGKKERISDLINRAGGVKPEGYLKAASFYRKGKLVAIDLASLSDDKKASNNLLLENSDSLYIPKAAETVSFKGQFLNPIEVAFQPDYSFQDYIAQAGGFTDSAYVKKTYVVYANGITDRTRSFLGLYVYPKVERGMTVVVPVKNRQRWSAAERISIGTGLISVAAVLLTLIRLF